MVHDWRTARCGSCSFGQNQRKNCRIKGGYPNQTFNKHSQILNKSENARYLWPFFPRSHKFCLEKVYFHRLGILLVMFTNQIRLHSFFRGRKNDLVIFLILEAWRILNSKNILKHLSVLWIKFCGTHVYTAELYRAECSIRKNHPIYTKKTYFAKNVLWIRSAKLVLHFSSFTPRNMLRE